MPLEVMIKEDKMKRHRGKESIDLYSINRRPNPNKIDHPPQPPSLSDLHHPSPRLRT
jgi:hypothetical protein